MLPNILYVTDVDNFTQVVGFHNLKPVSARWTGFCKLDSFDIIRLQIAANGVNESVLNEVLQILNRMAGSVNIPFAETGSQVVKSNLGEITNGAERQSEGIFKQL